MWPKLASGRVPFKADQSTKQPKKHHHQNDCIEKKCEENGGYFLFVFQQKTWLDPNLCSTFFSLKFICQILNSKTKNVS